MTRHRIPREYKDENRCTKITNSGERCKAPTLKGSQYCFQHDPSEEATKARTRARAKGGRKSADVFRSMKEVHENTKHFHNEDQIRGEAEKIIQSVKSGVMSPQKGKVILDALMLAAKFMKPSDDIESESRKMNAIYNAMPENVRLQVNLFEEKMIDLFNKYRRFIDQFDSARPSEGAKRLSEAPQDEPLEIDSLLIELDSLNEIEGIENWN